MDTLIDYLPILIPFIVLEIAVRVYCIVDIHKSDRQVLLLNKNVWTLLVAIVNFAWLIYLLGGRKE